MNKISRQSVNLIINALINKIIKKYPELRYIQILWILGIVDGEDKFYEEPNDTLTTCYLNIKQTLSTAELSSVFEELFQFSKEIVSILGKKAFFNYKDNCRIGEIIGFTEDYYVIKSLDNEILYISINNNLTVL